MIALEDIIWETLHHQLVDMDQNLLKSGACNVQSISTMGVSQHPTPEATGAAEETASGGVAS